MKADIAQAIAALAAAREDVSVRHVGTRMEISFQARPAAPSPASSMDPLADGTVERAFDTLDSPFDLPSDGPALVGHATTGAQDLADVLRLKEELSAAIAHDLRSPMAAVKGALDLLIAGTAGELSEDQQRYLGIAERSSRHVLALVSDLLDSSILDAGLARLDLEDVELGAFLADVAAEYRVLADEKGIEFALETPPVLPVVRADRRRLHQILGNLLSNAVKFTDPGGRVALVAVRDEPDGTVALRVADSGVGIPSARLPHLFDKYRRRQSRGTRGERGTGLGLYICKRLVDLHGGTITVDTSCGAGTTFDVRLPAAPRP